jgi:cbb3-type cytochrome oxidase subunit 3
MLYRTSVAHEAATVETIAYAAFIGIVVWVFGRQRKARFEKDARIPFDDNTGLEA